MNRLLPAAIACCLLAAPPAAHARLSVVATTPDLAAIARAVGGDRVEVESLVKGHQDPHYLQAKPSFMRTLNRADLLLYNGLELEVGYLPLLIEGARNPAIAPGAPGHLNASDGIAVLEVPTGPVDRSMGDVHPQGNPHYTLDPRNGLIVARRLAERLRQLDPEGANVYAAGLAIFEQDLITRIAEWERQTRRIQGAKVVGYHKLWEYLAAWLGFQVLDYVENKPGIPPSPRHVSSLVARIKADHIPALLTAGYADIRGAQRVAEDSGARLLVLPASVDGEEGVRTYADLFDRLVARLNDAVVRAD